MLSTRGVEQLGVSVEVLIVESVVELLYVSSAPRPSVVVGSRVGTTVAPCRVRQINTLVEHNVNLWIDQAFNGASNYSGHPHRLHVLMSHRAVTEWCAFRWKEASVLRNLETLLDALSGFLNDPLQHPHLSHSVVYYWTAAAWSAPVKFILRGVSTAHYRAMLDSLGS